MEWSSVALFASIVLIGVVLFAATIGGRIGNGMVCEVKQIFGGGCTAPAQTPSNEVVCEVATETRKASENMQLFFVKGEHDATMLKTVYSDGHVTYTVVQSGQLEAQYKLFQAEVEAGDVGFDAEAALAAGGQLTGSETFSFPSQEAANKFESEAKSTGGWREVAHDAAGPIGGWILDRFDVHGAPSEESLAKQYGDEMTSQYVSAGAVASVTGKAGAEAGPIGLDLDAELNGAGGARYITAGADKGDVQLYLSLDGDASGSLLAAAFGPEVNAKGSGDVEVTLGPDGQPLSLEITASGQAGHGAAFDGKGKGENSEGGSGEGGSGEGGGESGEEGESGEGNSATITRTLTAGEGVQYTADLDLKNNPAAVRGLTDLLGANPGNGVSEIANQIQSNGTQQLQPFQGSTSKSGVGVQAEVSDIGGGLGADVNDDNQQFSPGWIANPGQGWQQVVCKK